MVNYKIVATDFVNDFEAQANELLNGGYMPIGGLTYFQGTYVQGFILNFDEIALAMADKVSKGIEAKIDSEINLNEQ